MTEVATVTVSILDKDYQMNCKPDEVSALRQSADYLDQKMREIKNSIRIFGLERIAVIAALNIANEFLGMERKSHLITETYAAELDQLTSKLDLALNRLNTPQRK